MLRSCSFKVTKNEIAGRYCSTTISLNLGMIYGFNLHRKTHTQTVSDNSINFIRHLVFEQTNKLDLRDVAGKVDVVSTVVVVSGVVVINSIKIGVTKLQRNVPTVTICTSSLSGSDPDPSLFVHWCRTAIVKVEIGSISSKYAEAEELRPS